MKLLSIQLLNFRQFYGKQEINFSTDPVKNITLIHAENGVGKTALLNAIKWGLFGETTKNFKDNKILLNHIARSNGDTNLSVKIKFEEDEKIYVCERTSDFSNSIKFKIYQDTDDYGYKVVNDPELFINSIIPKDMSEYFFFQGEGMGSITNTGSGFNPKVKEAIQKILGFTTAKQTLDDLNIIKKEYLSEISKLDKEGEISKLSKEISSLEEIIYQGNNRLEKCTNNISYYTSEIEEIDKKLADSDHNVIKSLQKDRSELEASKLKLEADYRDKFNRRKKLISSYGTYIFSHALASKALDFIDDEEFKGTIPAPYNENLVRQILDEKHCICGSDINTGTVAYNNIVKLLESAADPTQGNRVTRARETLKSIRSKNQDSQENIINNIKDLDSIIGNIELTKKKLAEISLKLNDMTIEEISHLETTRSGHNKNKNIELNVQGAKTNELTRAKQELISKESHLHRLSSLSSELTTYRESLDIVKKVEELISTTLKTAETTVINDLSHMINKLLEKYVRQDYRASVNKDTYDIRLVDRNNIKVAESDGQQLLLSLTFISCLIELAAKRKNATGEILTPGAIAPFVIDAPFGVLDNKYKGNMAKSIPDSVEQVILMLSSSHWEGSVEENIRDKVGAEYNLVAEVNAEQSNKEKYSIKIQGHDHDTVRYNCPIDRTIIEEVKI